MFRSSVAAFYPSLRCVFYRVGRCHCGGFIIVFLRPVHSERRCKQDEGRLGCPASRTTITDRASQPSAEMMTIFTGSINSQGRIQGPPICPC